MNIRNAIKFISNPKGYVTYVVNKHIENITKYNLLIPIEQTQDNDIFIAGYPKSGNTWMQSLVAGLLYGIDTEFLPDKLAQDIVPDVHSLKYYKRYSKINFFKTHDLPQPKYKKVIYLVRDGRDAMVSYYNYNKNLQVNITLEEMVKEGKEMWPSKWHEHVKQWKSNPYNAEIITIRYEDLLEQPFVEMKKICQFANIQRSDEIIQKVIEGNNIDKMRQRVIETGGMGQRKFQGSEQGAKFFRKGKMGSYKSEMDEDLIKYFNKEAQNELAMHNYTL